MKKIKQKIKNKLLKYLLNTIVVSDIHTYNRHGKHFVNGVELTESAINALAQEINYFRNTHLYKILMSSVNNKAHKAIFDKSTSYDDIVAGKMLLYATSLQDNIMDSLFNAYKKQIKK